MQKKMLLGKIHRATVTCAALNYEGSCAIDKLLLDAAGMQAYEAIDIYNVNNGERFSTYIIEAPAGSGTISVNGAAARKAAVGDLLIIASYGLLSAEELESFKPKLVYVNKNNELTRTGSEILQPVSP